MQQDRRGMLLSRIDRILCREPDGQTGQVVESGKDRQDRLLRAGRTDRTGC